MRLIKKTSTIALAGVALAGSLSAFALSPPHTPVRNPDRVSPDKVVVNGKPLEAGFDSKGGLWVTSASTSSGWSIKRIDLASKSVQNYPLAPRGVEGMAEAPDGTMWFASRSNTLVSIANGVLKEHSLPQGYGRPWHIAAGPDGAMWFTASEYEDIPGYLGAIGRIGANGVINMYPLDQTRSVSKITAGPDGAMWATGPNSNEVVRITMQGAISYFPATVDIGDNAGITTGPDGNIWFTTGNRRHGQQAAVVKMDAQGKVIKTFTGDKIAEPMAIVKGKDGNIWFSSGNNGSAIGRIRMDHSIERLVLPTGRLPLQWGMAHNAATGDLWVVEPEAGALERYPTLGYVVRVAVTGDRALDETADATRNYALVAASGKKGQFIVNLAEWPNNESRIEAWSYNPKPDHPISRWHLGETSEPRSFQMVNVKSGQCVVAGDKNFQAPCSTEGTQRFEAQAMALPGQFSLFNASSGKCADFWYGYNYATAHPSGNFYGGHYALGGSYIGMYNCTSNYNQRFSFE